MEYIFYTPFSIEMYLIITNPYKSKLDFNGNQISLDTIYGVYF